MVRVLVLLIGIFTTSSSFATNLPCRLLPSFVELTSARHLKSPEIDAKMIAKVGKTYTDILDSENNYLTQPEYDEILLKLKKDSKIYLKKYEKEKCQVFKDIEDKIIAGEQRYFDISLKATQLEAKKTSLKSNSEKRFKSVSELEKNVNEYTRHKLFTKKYSKKELLDLVKNQSRPFDGFEKEKSEILLNSFLKTFDPHSSYFTESEYKQFDSEVNGNLVGIGVQVSQTKLGVLVESIIEGGAVEENGIIKPGDYLIAINGVKLKNIRSFLEEVKKTEENSSLTITVLDKQNKIKNIELTVRRIELKESKISSELINHNGKNVLVVTVPSFYYDEQKELGAAQDFLAEYNKYKNPSPISGKAPISIDLIVMDLRNDPGGLLSEALRLVGLFIEKNVVIYTKDTEGISAMYSEAVEEDQKILKEPLLVLTNRRSASSSEIVAGALKDYSRAIIVGQETTFGKGTVQSVLKEPSNLNLGAFKITIAQFYLPKGSSTQMKGVPSDIVIPGQPLENFGEKREPNALPWDEIETPFKSKKRFDYSKIAQLSKERVEKNQEKFKKLPKRIKKNEEDVVLLEALNIGDDYLKEKRKENDSNN